MVNVAMFRKKRRRLLELALMTACAIVVFETVFEEATPKPIDFISQLMLDLNIVACQPKFNVTIVTEPGRLGNKLYQYASLYGVSRRFCYIPVLSNESSLLFKVPRKHLKAKVIPDDQWKNTSWTKWVEEAGSAYVEAPFVEAMKKRNENIQLTAYLQSYKYFEGYEADVVRQLRFKPKVHKWARQYLQYHLKKLSHLNRTVEIVGMHVRRGDYLEKDIVLLGYRTPPKHFYRKAALYFTSRYPFVLFIVCSDNFGWTFKLMANLSKEPVFRNARFVVFRGSDDAPEKDLALLSLANHTIASVGTFSFWAAMMRQFRSGRRDNGKTLYYARPFTPGTFIAKTYLDRTSDFYPPDWISFE